MVPSVVYAAAGAILEHSEISSLGVVAQLKSIAIEERQVGRPYWSASPAKETGFGGLQALVGGNEGPGWIGLVILIGWN